ncbi:MAG TPA: acyl carrier protein [Prolixibacteraceae bacterium]|nr:acyl carrier protein [Prolixibacteraceae bacterium]
MMNEEIFNRVTGIISGTLNKKNLVLGYETSSKDVEGWDSLAHVTIITEVEKEFGITIDFMEILEIKTIGDICQAVVNNQK